MAKKVVKCASCGDTRAQHSGDEGCWGGLWGDCGCPRFDDGKPTSHEVAVKKAQMDGLIEKEAGQALALLTYEDWQTAFRREVLLLAATREPFTSEDALAVVGLPSGEIATNANNAVGAMMTALAKEGQIVKTGERAPSKRPSSHGAELTVWMGTRR